MQSWDMPQLPRLPRTDDQPALTVRDSRGRRVTPEPIDGVMRMYVCGITPYDATHLGHAATYLTFDLINRFWRDGDVEVNYTQNVTDVDDPLLERADETGVHWTELAEAEIQLFREDMTALRVLPPQAYIGAVEAVPQVIELLDRLQRARAIYEVPGDDVPQGRADLYFDIHSDPGFGEVSGYHRDAMLALSAERGGDPDRPGKRDRLDPLVWRAERRDEPAWESPFGRGRPGWHIECSAIAFDTLGPQVSLAGGGTDLIFPHHEMSTAHSQVGNGISPYAQAYVHQAMVGLDGEKMSKSKGNLVLVSRLREQRVDPMAIRLALLARHYQAEWSYTDSLLQNALVRLQTWREATERADGPSAAPVLAQVRRALADNLDAPAALRAVDEWCRLDGADVTEADSPAQVRTLIDALLGVRL